MTGYWEAWANQEFVKAGEMIYPADLRALHSVLSPIFLDAAKSENTEDRKIARAYLGQAQQLEDISPIDAFVGMHRVISIANPDLFRILAGSTVEVTDVHLGGNDSATVYYRVQIEGVTDGDTERMIKVNDQWYLRTKGRAEQVAQQFRALFGS